MRIKASSWLWLVLGVVPVAQAQMSLQRYYLESVGFEYVTQRESAKRCVQWRDLVNKNPRIEFEEGKPFVQIEVEARVEGDCPLTFADGQSLEFTEGEGSIRTFRFRVFPPSVSYLISGPGFSDQLIFEALVSQPEQVGFFKFFQNSQTKFDLGYGKFQTTNVTASADQRTRGVFPVMSGLITVPVPWVPMVQLGFSLSQNLSNFLPDDDVKFQFSEFAFDARFVIGMPSPRRVLAIVGEVRGRNWYQLGDVKPFVVRSSPGVGVGVDYDDWIGRTPWGFSLTGRYGFRSAEGAKALGEMRAGGSINYKVSPKWAIGVGYRWARLGVDFSDTAGQTQLGKLYETSHLINLSLILVGGHGGRGK
ncbi:MAG TPA: hypothetical protein VM901_11995 [Bdellovibrionota bacterium]|nr:hypothetical protein [Bdellovibrionota bacterium]